MSPPLSPAPVKGRLPDALPPYLSNGVLGIRFPSVPHLAGTTMVNGFAGLDPGRRRRRFRASAFRRWQPMSRSTVSGRPTAPEWIRLLEQRYDFATGELLDALDASESDGTHRDVETIAFCSAVGPRLGRLDVQCQGRWPGRRCAGRRDRPDWRARCRGDGSRPAAGPGSERGCRWAAALALTGRHLHAGHGLHDDVPRRRGGGARPQPLATSAAGSRRRTGSGPGGPALPAQPADGGRARPVACATR